MQEAAKKVKDDMAAHAELAPDSTAEMGVGAPEVTESTEPPARAQDEPAIEQQEAVHTEKGGEPAPKAHSSATRRLLARIEENLRSKYVTGNMCFGCGSALKRVHYFRRCGAGRTPSRGRICPRCHSQLDPRAQTTWHRRQLPAAQTPKADKSEGRRPFGSQSVWTRGSGFRKSPYDRYPPARPR